MAEDARVRERAAVPLHVEGRRPRLRSAVHHSQGTIIDKYLYLYISLVE